MKTERETTWRQVNKVLKDLEHEIYWTDVEMNNVRSRIKHVAPHVRVSTMHAHQARFMHGRLSKLLAQLERDEFPAQEGPTP